MASLHMQRDAALVCRILLSAKGAIPHEPGAEPQVLETGKEKR
jgi:urease beta subunit